LLTANGDNIDDINNCGRFGRSDVRSGVDGTPHNMPRLRK